MKQSHKLFSLLALATLIQISFAMGGRPPAASEPNGSQEGEANIRITNNEKLEFLDSRGQVRDQLSLGTEKVLKPGNKAQIVSRNAVASRDGSRALFIESRGPEFVDVTPSDGEVDDTHKETSHIKVLDKTGNIIWQKQLPDDRLVTSADFSTDGKTMGTIQIWTNYSNAHHAEPVEQLVVYDESGKAILEFPKKPTPYRLHGDVKMSPSGQYIAIRGSINQKPAWIVIDINSGALRQIETPEFIRQVFDDGTIRFRKKEGVQEKVKFDALEAINAH